MEKFTTDSWRFQGRELGERLDRPSHGQRAAEESSILGPKGLGARHGRTTRVAPIDARAQGDEHGRGGAQACSPASTRQDPEHIAQELEASARLRLLPQHGQVHGLH